MKLRNHPTGNTECTPCSPLPPVYMNSVLFAFIDRCPKVQVQTLIAKVVKAVTPNEGEKDEDVLKQEIGGKLDSHIIC